MIQPPKNLKSFESFVEIVEALRGPNGCPWDKEQTHHSLVPYAIEETFELVEAIEDLETTKDETEFIGELGDVLLQVVLHAEIARQEKRFDIHDVISKISEKMVRRHPHVFSDATAKDSSEVLDQWAQIKAEEKKQNTSKPKTARFDIPVGLPSLSRSQKIGSKTKRERFDWSNAIEVLAKVDEELNEVKAEIPAQPSKEELQKNRAAIEHEIGDLLFSVAQLARHADIDAEQALRTANSRFESRFFNMKKMIAESGRNYDDLSSAELESAWQDSKRALAKKD